MKWARGEIEPWRRTDFRDKPDPFPGNTLQSPLVGRAPGIIVILANRHPFRDRASAAQTLGATIRVSGVDWHIYPTTFEDQERIVALLRLNKIHGVIRRRRAV